MLIQSCISVHKSYGHQKISIHKTCAAPQQVSETRDDDADNTDVDSIKSCKQCSKSESVFKMLLCDRCEEAFHVSCCKPEVVLPIDEWFCDSCIKITKTRSIGEGIGVCVFGLGPVLGPIEAMLKQTEPFTSKVRIGEAYQARIPNWRQRTRVKIDNRDCSVSDVSQLGSPTACRKRKQEFPSQDRESVKKCQF